MTIEFSSQIKFIANVIRRHGGTLFVVGGAVRDDIMFTPCVDQDFVIQGISVQKAKDIISKHSDTEIKDVISNAPVFMARIDGEDFEFVMCRKEVSITPGKSGFEFFSDPHISIFDDLERRDFSINSIARNVITGEEIDPFNGRQDIKDKILRHVSDAFIQSPERVIRGASFASRFEFDVHSTTVDIMRKMLVDFNTIPPEQFWRHFEKMAQKSKRPSIFVDVLDACHWNDFFEIVATDNELDQECPEGIDKVSWVISRMIIAKSESERERFFDMICAPNKVRREACEFEFWDGKKPEAIVQGRDIIDFVKPGKEMGILLEQAFKAQISGVFRTKAGGVAFIKRQVEM